MEHAQCTWVLNLGKMNDLNGLIWLPWLAPPSERYAPAPLLSRRCTPPPPSALSYSHQSSPNQLAHADTHTHTYTQRTTTAPYPRHKPPPAWRSPLYLMTISATWIWSYRATDKDMANNITEISLRVLKQSATVTPHLAYIHPSRGLSVLCQAQIAR